MATIARGASIVSIESYFCEARDVRDRLTLMRLEEKEDKIELAEGLS